MAHQPGVKACLWRSVKFSVVLRPVPHPKNVRRLHRVWQRSHPQLAINQAYLYSPQTTIARLLYTILFTLVRFCSNFPPSHSRFDFIA